MSFRHVAAAADTNLIKTVSSLLVGLAWMGRQSYREHNTQEVWGYDAYYDRVRLLLFVFGHFDYLTTYPIWTHILLAVDRIYMRRFCMFFFFFFSFLSNFTQMWSSCVPDGGIVAQAYWLLHWWEWDTRRSRIQLAIGIDCVYKNLYVHNTGRLIVKVIIFLIFFLMAVALYKIKSCIKKFLF